MTIKKIVYHPVSGKTNNFLLLGVALLPAVLFFPYPVSFFSNGIDPPLAWVFNFLIGGNLMLGKHIIFPHGPLAFLMYPLPEGANLWIAISVHIAARIFMAYSLLKLATRKPLYCLLFALVSSFILLALNDFLLTLIQVIVLCYLNFFERRNVTWLIPALIITALALYIKAFVGIVGIIVTLSFAGIMVYRAVAGLETWYRLLMLLIVPLVLVITWLGLYGELSGFTAYFDGMLILAADNSAAVAVYPENNWWWISIGLLGGLILIMINIKNIAAIRFAILAGPALFAVWKYGMAREDYLHASLLFIFILFLVLVFNVVSGKFRIANAVFSVLVIVLFYLTMQNAFYYEPLPVHANGLKTLISKTGNYKYFSDTCKQASEKLIVRNKLDNRIIRMIGQRTVDIYPWDYSYIAANQFNWQPRPVIQSYASYARDLDQLNARHFRSEKAPEFIIWELRKITHDIHGGMLESIDGRYLPNDEPDTFMELLKRYELVDSQEGIFPVLVFRKLDQTRDSQEQIVGKTKATWNTWISVPENSTDILRASVQMQRNLPGNLKSFFYKDEAAFVYYLLANGDIRMYRIVPKNAAYGLWINPLVMNPETGRNEPAVKKIMFRCSNTAMMKEEISIEWKQISFSRHGTPQANPVFPFFGINPELFPVQILKSENNLEEKVSNWTSPDETKIELTGRNRALRLPADAYSVTFTYPLDSMLPEYKNSELIVRTGIWARSADSPKAVYVISVEKNGETVLWKAVDIQNFIHDPATMNFVTNFVVLSEDILSQKGLVLKVYAWNTGKENILLDDFSVRIETW